MHLRSITAVLLALVAASTTSSVPLNKRIVNGTPVQEGELPFFALINGCGGVLIGPQTILTAAHCVNFPKAFKNVFLGGVAIGEGKKLKYAMAVRHPGYNTTASVNDIAVAFLPEKADGPYASIEGTSYPDEGSKLTVAGYGDTSANGTSTDHLLKVQVTMGSKVECAAHKNTQDRFFDPNTQVCAIDNGYSACKGDSGGPLYSGSGKDLHIVGVVSGSGKENRCGEKGTFQYYTFVKPFISWINSEIEKFEKNGADSTIGTDTDM